MSTANAKHAENRRKLTRAEKKEIAALIRAAKGDGKAHTAQQTIPYLAMYPDGICKVTEKKYSKSIAYDDINYQLAQADDKTAIFENWCDFLNYFDATVSVQLSFINRGTRSGGRCDPRAKRRFQFHPHRIRGYAETSACKGQQRLCKVKVHYLFRGSGQFERGKGAACPY